MGSLALNFGGIVTEAVFRYDLIKTKISRKNHNTPKIFTLIDLKIIFILKVMDKFRYLNLSRS